MEIGGVASVRSLYWTAVGALASHIKNQVPRLRTPLGEEKCIGSFFIALVSQDR